MMITEKHAKTIFLNALEITSEADRQSFVEAQCGNDYALRHEVVALLDQHGRMGSFLAAEQVALSAAPEIDHPLGSRVGPYKLLQEIGEGGMGTVFMAEQTAPVQRMVALKIIKPGMDSRRVIARFEAERQALAMMDHPNIAKVLDAGATETGRPYFVMELVKGVSIIQYCDEHRLPRASAWNCSSKSARRCSTPIKRELSIAILSPRTFWWPITTSVP